jgi:hypothetical protein
MSKSKHLAGSAGSSLITLIILITLNNPSNPNNIVYRDLRTLKNPNKPLIYSGQCAGAVSIGTRGPFN